jgi:hypothetical protein
MRGERETRWGDPTLNHYKEKTNVVKENTKSKPNI